MAMGKLVFFFGVGGGSRVFTWLLTLILLNLDLLSFFENGIDPDQMASDEAI